MSTEGCEWYISTQLQGVEHNRAHNNDGDISGTKYRACGAAFVRVSEAYRTICINKWRQMIGLGSDKESGVPTVLSLLQLPSR